MRKLRLSDAAQRDLTDIAEYTERVWGTEQKRVYLDRLSERFQYIRAHPTQGTPRDNLQLGSRSLPSGSHLIFYRMTPDAIEIVRVLHRRMDLRRHLRDD